jgi:hypothetical protein
MALWFITVYAYQINDYYDYYFPGDQFEALIALSTIELLGYVVADLVYECFKTQKIKKLFYFSYTICLIAAISLVINDKDEYPWIDLTCEFIAKFGIACAF